MAMDVDFRAFSVSKSYARLDRVNVSPDAVDAVEKKNIWH